MKKLVILLVLMVFFTACIANNAYQPIVNQSQEKPLPDGEIKEVPFAVTKNFTAINHPMQLSNPLWKLPVKYNLSFEPGIDSYRLNITIKAVYAGIAELESITNSSLQFTAVEKNDADLIIEINTSLKQIDSAALGVSRIESYVSRGSYNEILKARIGLTPTYPCAAKIEAMHEILHTLGFAHSSETNSIMYAYGAVCTSKVTNSIKQTLNALYK